MRRTVGVLGAVAVTVAALATPAAAEGRPCQGEYLTYAPIETDDGIQLGELGVYADEDTGEKCAITSVFEGGGNAQVYVSLGVCAESQPGDTCTVRDFYEAAAGDWSVHTLPLYADGKCVQAVGAITVGDTEATGETTPAASTCD